MKYGFAIFMSGLAVAMGSSAAATTAAVDPREPTSAECSALLHADKNRHDALGHVMIAKDQLAIARRLLANTMGNRSEAASRVAEKEHFLDSAENKLDKASKAESTVTHAIEKAGHDWRRCHGIVQVRPH